VTATAFWNDLAEKYSRKPLEDPSAFERKIEVTKSRMKPDDVVLDIGCGTGSLALRLSSHAARVHGLDFSSAMIRIADEKTRSHRVDNVHFHTGPFDASFAVFADESLDGICAYSILHLFEDRADALKRIYRLLKPGGFFISSTVCLGESRAPYAPVLRIMRWLGKAPEVAILRKSTLCDDVARAGFVKLTQPDVGAKPTIMFLVAFKPH
jgi:arsenite methyltransferase